MTKNKRILVLLTLLIISNLLTFAQSEFSTFLELFYEYKWEELTGPSKYLEIKDTINYQYANRNMWNEHTDKVRRRTVGLSYTTRAPHIRINDSTYAKYHHGLHGLYYGGMKISTYKNGEFSNSYIKNNLYAIGKVNITEDVVLLIIKYEYYDPEEGHSSSIEAFTFRLSD